LIKPLFNKIIRYKSYILIDPNLFNYIIVKSKDYNMNTSSKSLLDLIKYPILTEKTSRLIEQNQYSFAVDKKADKVSIKRAIEYLFAVKVTSVNTANSPSKKRRVGKFIGEKTQNKRVIVTLAPENSITFFENA